MGGETLRAMRVGMTARHPHGGKLCAAEAFCENNAKNRG